MTIKQRFTFSFLLFVVSIVLSAGTFITKRYGWGEIYPFFYWKLYSQPHGLEKTKGDFRVYGKNKSDNTWQRISNTGYPNFNQDDYYYFLSSHNALLAKNEDSIVVKKIYSFCNYIAPQYEEYQIVEEVYIPLNSLKNPTQFDTTVVLQLP